MISDMTSNPVSKFPMMMEAYEILLSKHHLAVAEITGRAIESGEMVSILEDPHSVLPKHIQLAIQKLERRFERAVASLLKRWSPTRDDSKTYKH